MQKIGDIIDTNSTQREINDDETNIQVPQNIVNHNTLKFIKTYLHKNVPTIIYSILRVPYRITRSIYRIIFNKHHLGRKTILKNELKINSKFLYYLIKNTYDMAKHDVNTSYIRHIENSSSHMMTQVKNTQHCLSRQIKNVHQDFNRQIRNTQQNINRQIDHIQQYPMLREMVYNNQFKIRADKYFDFNDIFTSYKNVALNKFFKNSTCETFFNLVDNLNIVDYDDKSLRLCDAFFTWGNDPLPEQILNAAIITRNPIIFCEDGFLRSKTTFVDRKASKQDRMSYAYTFDDLGYHFDIHKPNRLIQKLSSNDHLSHDQNIRAQTNIKNILDNHISKYNHQPLIHHMIGTRINKVVIIDQSPTDYSLLKGNITYDTIFNMVLIALKENPNSDIIVKIHPDNIINNDHLRQVLQHRIQRHAEYNKKLFIYKESANPISFLEKIDKVYVFSSQMGFEALMLNKEVITFGTPFYAGWGLTEDRNPMLLAQRYNNGQVITQRTVNEVFYFVYIWYTYYVSPFSHTPCEIEEVIEYFTQENQPLLTICIHSYNSSNYLHTAINNILLQDNKYINILIIDDESTDNSRDIIDYYKKKNDRISTIYLDKHQGAYHSRLEVLKNIKTKYITFLDTTDYFSSNQLTNIISTLKRYEPNLLTFDLQYSDIKGNMRTPIFNRIDQNPSAYFNYRDEIFIGTLSHRLVANIYNTEIFTDALMEILSNIDEFSYANDLLFAIIIAPQCEYSCYMFDNIYHSYKVNTTSDITTTLKNCQDLHNVIQYLYKLIESQYFETQDVELVLIRCLNTISTMFKNNMNECYDSTYKESFSHSFTEIFQDDFNIFKGYAHLVEQCEILEKLIEDSTAE